MILTRASLLIILLIILNVAESARNTQDSHSQLTKLYNSERFEHQIIVVGANGQLWSIDRLTGDHLWNFHTHQPIFTFHNLQTDTDSNFILIPSTNGELYTFENGSLHKVHLTIQQLVAGAPLITPDGSFWIASKIMDMWALDAWGNVLHSWTAEESQKMFINHNEDVLRDSLVIVRTTYIIQALDSTTGRTKWNMTVSEFLSQDKADRSSKIPIANEDEQEDQQRVLVTSDGSVFAYNVNEKQFMWKSTFPVGAISVYNVRQISAVPASHWRLFSPADPILPPQLSLSLPATDKKSSGIFVGVFHGHLYAIPIDTSTQDLIIPSYSTNPGISNPHILEIAASDGDDDALEGLPRHNELAAILQQPLSSECNQYSLNFPQCLVGSLRFFTPGEESTALSVLPNLPAPMEIYQPLSPPYKNISLPITVDNNNMNTMDYLHYINLLLLSLILCLIIIWVLFNYVWKRKPADSIVEPEKPVPEPPVLTPTLLERQIKKAAKALSQKSPNPLNSHPPLTIGRLFVDNTILGHGSSGTIVYLGSLDGRKVAVKRMLREYYDLAYQELSLLQQSDEHNYVVRYYTHEKDQNFIYLALSYCTMNLEQWLTSKPNSNNNNNNSNSNRNRRKGRKNNNGSNNITSVVGSGDDHKVEMQTGTVSKAMLHQLVIGLQHIHSLQIVHRDLKPHNVLIDPKGNIKISDMGLAKKLEMNQHSFSSPNSCGTLGWQAPEQIQNLRLTNKIDIFSLGCIIYYCLTGGQHPFGEQIERENNIVKNVHYLQKLEKTDATAQDLIARMIHPKPAKRITASEASIHPLFWNSEKILDFYRIASDRLEVEKPSAAIVIAIENRAMSIIGSSNNWLLALDAQLRTELQTSKFRKYNGLVIRDLLRVIRNKIHHYHDLPSDAQAALGPLPDGFLNYWSSRFPRLLVETFIVIEQHCKSEPNFKQFFCI